MVMEQSRSLGWSCVWWKNILSPKPYMRTGETLQTASFLVPTHLQANAWQMPAEDAEEFGMEGEPWQWKAGRLCLCACLPSREMLIDGGTARWRLNQSLCLWLPCEHGRCWVQLQTLWSWEAQRCIWSIHLSQQLGSCSPTSFCSVGAEVLQDLLHVDGRAKFQQLLWQITGPGVTEPGFVYALVAGVLCLLTCCSVSAHVFAPADSFMGC